MDSQRSRGSAESLRPGDPERVGSYTILGRIGQGGMGAVYLGQAPDGRRVAVKVVRPELARDSGFVARFRDEVANAQRVASFCTAQVLDHGESAGQAYMVTEYIDGVSLKEYVAENGELSPGMLQGVAVGVAAALVAIHSVGLIHRDLKPANVLLSYSGPRVIDFGIARALDAAYGHTMTGQVIGSPGWMAPEQILQQPVTTAVDIFAWGCLVAFARNGVNPFGTGDMSVMAARLVHADPQVGPLPAPLDRLVRAALAKDPRKRPTARDLLLAIVGGETNEAAVLSTLWQPPIVPHSETLPADAPPPAKAGPPAYGPPPTEASPPAYGPPPTEASPPAYGPTQTPSPGGRPYAAPVAYGATAPAGPPTMPAGPAVPSPTQAGDSGTPALPPRQPARPRRSRALLAGATAAVVAAGAVAGWLVFRPHHEPAANTAAKSKGPAPLPTASLVTRFDRAAGWPKTCHGSIGVLNPVTKAVTTPLAETDQCDYLPKWSPDRTRIAFTRTEGTVNQVWVMNANGSNASMISDQMPIRSRVAWSPDGKKIAMIGRKGTSHELEVITLSDPKSPMWLTNDGSEKDDPAWCGSKVAFWSKKSGTQQIYTADATKPGGPWSQVTHMSHDVNDPAFSPDCTKMAYTDQPDNVDRHIWVTNVDGAQNHQLTNGRDMDPAWSKDGNWITFVRGATAYPRIWAIRADGTGEQAIAPTDHYMGQPDWY